MMLMHQYPRGTDGNVMHVKITVPKLTPGILVYQVNVNDTLMNLLNGLAQVAEALNLQCTLVIRFRIRPNVSGQLLHLGEATQDKVGTHVCPVYLLGMMVLRMHKPNALMVMILVMMHIYPRKKFQEKNPGTPMNLLVRELPQDLRTQRISNLVPV